MNYKPYEITVESIYGQSNPAIPIDWENTEEFRLPKRGEYYLSCRTGVVQASADYATDIPQPRIILRKKKIKRIIYTQVRTGTPQPGEYYQSLFEDGKQMFRCISGEDSYMKRYHPEVPIFKREEEEV